MNPENTLNYLRWLNRLDPRVELNDATTEAWGRALAAFDPRLVKEVTLTYTQQTKDKPTVAEIKKLCSAEKRRISELEAQFAARSIDPHKKPLGAWKAKYPGRWEQCKAEGAAMRDNDLTARNIPLDHRQDTEGLNIIHAPHPRMV